MNDRPSNEAHIKHGVMRHGRDETRYRCAVVRKSYRPRTDEQKKAEAVAFRAWLDKPMTRGAKAAHHAEFVHGSLDPLVMFVENGRRIGTTRPRKHGHFSRHYIKGRAKKVRAARKRRRGWA